MQEVKKQLQLILVKQISYQFGFFKMKSGYQNVQFQVVEQTIGRKLAKLGLTATFP